MIDQVTALGTSESKQTNVHAFAYTSHALVAGAIVAAALVAQVALARPVSAAVPAPAVKPSLHVATLPRIEVVPPVVAPVAPAAAPWIVEVAPQPVAPATTQLVYAAPRRDTWTVESGAPRAVAAPAVAAKPKYVPETPDFLKGPIAKASAKYGIPTEVLSAALARESANFKSKYLYGYHVDGTGRGVAGIDKKYHPNVSDAQAFDPVFAVDWMGQYLAGILKKNGGNVYNALREYNGGANYASSRAGYQGRTVAELTKTHADAIMAHASKARAV